MATAFSRTLRSLEADRFRSKALGLLIAAGLLGAWGFWATQFHLSLYEVTEAARLEIIPAGKLHIVAQFPPSALGRIRTGQPARMRLGGFPWAEFGAVHAQVDRVADEMRDDTVRVELSVLDSPGLRAPLKHGMPGSLEIEVEQSTPLALLLRTAGQTFTSTRDRYPSAERH